ncbi:hypothetical protein VDGD_10452 [Verticillium dahliae]|nr:hypothetical protein VdG1_06138 [Verticillium dahliae VDG1]RBQ66551.1 hypothetical protein VDGD_10452 [Verticillium dahliae]
MPKPHILLFSKTTAYRHTSIEPAVAALLALASTSGLFTAAHSEDAEASFAGDSLRAFTAVILLHCSGEFLTVKQLGALQVFVRRGGGVVAVHGAASGMKSSLWYGELVGAHFDMHPPPEPGTVVAEGRHYILGNATGREHWMDEWYNFVTHPRARQGLRVLLRGDTTSFQGGRMGDDHPLAWVSEFEGGRSFYTALGHFDEAYSDEWFMALLTRGILWVSRAEEPWNPETRATGT